MTRSGLVLAAVVIARTLGCGASHEGPPPRYAEAPPEPGSGEDAEPQVAPGQGADAQGQAADAAAAEADAGVPAADGGAVSEGPILATGELTQAQWDSLLAAGRRKFNRVCAECHGTGIGPTLNGRRRTADFVRNTVRRGRGDMRPLSIRRVSDEDLEAVLVFLSTIRTVSDVAPPAAAQ